MFYLMFYMLFNVNVLHSLVARSGPGPAPGSASVASARAPAYVDALRAQSSKDVVEDGSGGWAAGPGKL